VSGAGRAGDGGAARRCILARALGRDAWERRQTGGDLMTSTTPAIAGLFSARARALEGAALRVGALDRGISFAFGLPDPGSMPIEGVIAATERALHAPGGAWALQYGSAKGQAGLLEVLVEKLARDQRIAVTPEHLIVTNGSFHAIELVAQAFIDPGDTILVEAPTWSGAVMIFQRAGAVPVTVPMTEEGIDLDALEATLADLDARGIRPKFLYTLPTFHNPRGVTQPAAARRRLVAIAQRHGLPLIEDDAYFDLRFEGEHLPTLYQLDDAGLVIYLSTFSKILAAGMRLGWAVAHPAITAKLVLLKNDTGSSPFGQHVAEAFARSGELRAHIDRLAGVYRHKRDLMLAALAAEMPPGVTWSRPAGGFFVWLTLPPGITSPALLARGREVGIDFLPGTACYGDGRGTSEVRLAFSFVDAGQIEPGIRLLGQAIHDLQARA
jgi:2-aminoadipate transaminase